MYEFVRLDLKNLDVKSLDDLDRLTRPEFRPCLRGRDPFNISDTLIIAIGAYDQFKKPVGLSLASLKLHLHLADIHSLYVCPENRNQKIGTELLALMQEELKKEKATILSLTYPLEDDSTLALERILQTNGWANSRPFMVRCLFTQDKFPRHWFQKPIKYPSSFQEFFWKDITDEDRKNLRIMLAQKIVPPAVSPFIDENLIEPINSLGLRHNGKIVGWLITHRVNPETIRYSSFFIMRDYRYYGYVMKLLVDAIELHLQSSVLQGMLELPLLQVSQSWVRFINRRIIPHATSVTHINQAWRKL